MMMFKFVTVFVEGQESTQESNLCHRSVQVRRFRNEESAIKGFPEPKFEELPSCVYSLDPSEVAMGVFHCKSHEEGRLTSVASTWGKTLLNRESDGLSTFLLASKGGVARGSRFPTESLIVTNEVADDYKSTLPKGLLGLQGMFESSPNSKWFGVVGDDVFVDSHNLVHLLSAFDPDGEWCIVDGATLKKKVQGSSWRIFGGAPVITSRGLTKRLVPFLKTFSDRADRNIVHDMQFTMLMASKGGGVHKIIHVDGLYSQGPGVYLNCPSNPGSCPKVKPKLPSTHVTHPGSERWLPAAYHHITTDAYMRFLHVLHHQARVCLSQGEPQRRYSLTIGLPTSKQLQGAHEQSKFVYFDMNGEIAQHTQKAKPKKPFHGVAVASSGWHRGMTQSGASHIAGSMYALHPKSDWFVIIPLEAPFIQENMLHSFIDLMCDKQRRGCDCDKPRVITADETFQGVVLVSRGAAKLAILAGGLAAVDGVDIRISSLLGSLVIADAVAFQKDKLAGPKSGPDDCALVLSTQVPLSGMHWGGRESPLALAKALLR